METAAETTLQRLPEELLILILQHVSFRGLRNLLYCPSERLASLANLRLHEWQACLRARPGAAEELATVTRAWDERPWPEIEEVGRRLLGKEFVLVKTHVKDGYVSRSDTRGQVGRKLTCLLLSRSQ